MKILEMINGMSMTSRWSRMHCTKPESVLEHTGFVSMYALHLCFKHNLDVETIHNAVVKAVVHDIEESKIGDITTPTKYHNKGIAEEINKLEHKYAKEVSDECFFGKAYNAWKYAKNKDSNSGCIVAIADSAAVVYKVRQELALGNSTFKDVIPRLTDSLFELRRRVFVGYMEDVTELIDLIEEIK